MGQIEVVKFGPTQEQTDYRKALIHLVLPQVVSKCEIHGEPTMESVREAAKVAAQMTAAFVDAMIEELEE